MGLGHEKLDVYRLSIGYMAWFYEKADRLNGFHRSDRDQCFAQVSGRGYCVKEDSAAYGCSEFDFDPEEIKSQPQNSADE